MSARESSFAAVLAGREPAESLRLTRNRDALVRLLHDRGWSDLRIAEHTRWSTYTVARIRSRLGLSPRAVTGEEVG